jgi:hypothetical protein
MPSPGDKACTSCVKSSCCAEITACDSNCETAYGVFQSCLVDAQGNASGYSTNYCKSASGVDKNPAALALIDCASMHCGNDQACGAEPKITFGNTAANFFEKYCDGCHFDGYGDMKMHLGFIDTDNFNNDTSWDDDTAWGGPATGVPFGNPNWFSQMNFSVIKAKSDLIWCGVATVLPGGCDPTKFPKTKLFPPDGKTDMDHLMNLEHCWWSPDSQTCDQPTDFERNQISAWIFDGMPQ